MKLIFLDIDGVLNYEGYGRLTRSGTRFVDPVLIKRLKKIIDCTGAKVVLSSTWRRGIYDMREGLINTVDALDAEELLAELNRYGVEIFGTTLNGIKALRECRNIKINASTAVSPEFCWKCSI